MAKITKISYTSKPTNNSIYQFFIYSEGFDPKKETLIFKISYRFYYPAYNAETKRHYLEVAKNDLEFESGKTASDHKIRLFCYDFQKDATNYVATGSIKVYKSTASSSIPYWGFSALVKAAITSDKPWIDGLTVTAVWGPYQDDQPVKKIDLSKPVKYAAITNKPGLSQAQLLSVQWSYSINGGEKNKFGTKVEWSQDTESNRAIMQFTPIKEWNGMNIKVYAFFKGASEEVAAKAPGYYTTQVKSPPTVKSTDGSPQLVWGNKVSLEFEKKVVAVAKELWGDERKYEMANGLMAVMNVETWGDFKAQHLEGEISSRDPKTMTIKNFHKKGNTKSSRAVGLIQFTQDALQAMGEFPKSTPQTKGTQERYDALNKLKLEYAQMGELNQLDKVKKYFYPSRNSIKSPEEIYVQVFAPQGVGKPNNYILYKKGTDGYDLNKSMDSNTEDDSNQGISRGELLARYWKSYNEGLNNKKGKGSGSVPANNSQNSSDDNKEVTKGVFNANGIITYKIYHNGTIEKHIPKVIKPEYKSKMKYCFIDSNDQEHYVCTAEYHLTKELSTGKVYNSKPTHAKIISDTYVSENSTERRVLYQNGDIAEYGTHPTKGKIWLLYKAQNTFATLVRMPETQNYVSYTFTSTKRKYTGADAFAGFIGILGLTKLNITTSGSCFSGGSSFPSQEHNNGQSVDTYYFWVVKTDQAIIDASNLFHFTEILMGNKPYFSKLKNAKDGGKLHNSHLHNGNIEHSKIIEIHEK